ncbi:MAG TPA: PilZ domain-containing protein [Polyangiaceae bacterium]
MNKRRSLTPSTGMPNVSPGAHAMRRGGRRHTVSERVTFRPRRGGNEDGANEPAREGWVLNISRGGLRAILDEGTGKVELGDEFEILVGDPESALGKHGRIVWLQEEPDGFVVGVEYVGLSGTHSAVPPAPESTASVDASGENPASSAGDPERN